MVHPSILSGSTSLSPSHLKSVGVEAAGAFSSETPFLMSASNSVMPGCREKGTCLLIAFDEGLDAAVVCEIVDKFVSEVHIGHGVSVDASAPT